MILLNGGKMNKVKFSDGLNNLSNRLWTNSDIVLLYDLRINIRECGFPIPKQIKNLINNLDYIWKTIMYNFEDINNLGD